MYTLYRIYRSVVYMNYDFQLAGLRSFANLSIDNQSCVDGCSFAPSMHEHGIISYDAVGLAGEGFSSKKYQIDRGYNESQQIIDLRNTKLPRGFCIEPHHS